MKFSLGIIGNSSSGVIEAPLLNKPSINIGSRQEGRINYPSVINAKNSIKDISINLTKLIKLNGSVKANIKNPKKYPSKIILNKLKKLLIYDSYVKQFYDL